VTGDPYYRRPSSGNVDRVVHFATTSEQRLAVPDTRDFTGKFLGDPIPGDRRRELFPGKNYAGTNRWWD
jgi:hypothetical protein